MLAETGLPAILLSYTYASRFQTGCPPVFSSLRPPATKTPTLGFRSVFALHWLWAVGTSGWGIDGISLRLKRTFIKLSARALSVRWGRRRRRFGLRSDWSEYRRLPRIPEIVFGHRILDWPAIASTPGRLYFGATDLFRKKTVFDWSPFALDRPIVLCNLSTAGRFQEVRVSATGAQSGSQMLPRRRNFGWPNAIWMS